MPVNIVVPVLFYSEVLVGNTMVTFLNGKILQCKILPVKICFSCGSAAIFPTLGPRLKA